MAALSEKLADLSARAKKTEDEVAVAKTEIADKLKARRTAIQANIQTNLDELDTKVQHVKGIASSRLSDLKSKIKSDQAQVKQFFSEQATKIDAVISADMADALEADAFIAIQYAEYAIVQAEAAVLDAMAARLEAESYKTA